MSGRGTCVAQGGSERIETPRAPEAAAVAAVLLLFVFACALLAPRTIPGSDEPGYTDPAASWALGQGFTSGAWYAQDSSQFFAGNVPLHHIALGYAFRIFGFGPTTARMFNVALVALAGLLVWVALARLRVFGPIYRVGCVGILLFSESAMFMGLIGRPDAITCAIAASAFLAVTIRAPWIRYPSIFLCAGAAPWAGMQLCVAGGFAAIVATLLVRPVPWRDAAVAAAGGFVGLMGLLCFYDVIGVIGAFRESVFPHVGASGASQYRYNGFWGDRSLMILWSACALVVSIVAVSRRSNTMAKLLALGLGAAAFGLPVMLALAGKFSSVYTWMPTWVACPIVLVCIARGVLPPHARIAAVSLVIASAVVGGYPRLFLKAASDWGDLPVMKAEAFAAENVRSGDAVVYANPVFYAVKARASRAFYANWYFRAMTPKERSEISLALIEPGYLPLLEKATGVRWKEAGEALTLTIRRFMRPNQTLVVQPYRRGE